jgi:hypothetical protein
VLICGFYSLDFTAGLWINCGWTGLSHGSAVGRTGFFPVLTFFPAGAGRSRNMLSVQSPIRYENPSITGYYRTPGRHPAMFNF